MDNYTYAFEVFKSHMNKTNSWPLEEKKILEIGKKSKFKGHGQYVKLNRSILDPALEWGLIKTEGKRRGCLIYLTQEGKKWIKLL